ncbi:MAG: LysR family transcriptional regulator [Comamonadaceae bacterium]|nr:MAG: LysR family transcriptional regulator [Comamonadaceae bacterium]
MKEPTFATDRIELLQTFVRIVESGSLSAAALRMDTTQPTVSRRLQALERLFGVRLLQRSTHAVKLTADGERCFALSRSLLDEWQAMEEDLRGTRDAPTGTLRVLVPHAFGQAQLVAPLARYLDAYPEVRVEWLLHDRRPDFIAEGIDCAIQVGAVDDPSVVAVPLFEVPRIVIGAPALLAGREAVRDARDLQAFPWLAFQTFYRDRVVLNRARDGATEAFTIQPRLSTDSLYALRSAALAGLGVGIVSAWLVEDDLRAQRLVHLAPDWAAAPLPVHAVYPYARYYPARLRRFLEVIRAEPR